MSNKLPAIAGITRELAASHRYLLRALLAVCLVAAILTKAVRARYAVNYLDYPWDHFKALVDVVSQLDVFHALFYALTPALLILLCAPAGRAVKSTTPRRAVLCAFAASLTTAALPFAAVHWVRPTLAIRPAFVLACLFVGINVLAMVWRLQGLSWSRRLSRIVRYGFPVLDLLVPMWVWADYYKTRERILVLWCPVPVGLIVLAPFLPWLLAPESARSLPPLAPAVRQIAEGEYYQVVVDPAAPRLVTVAQESHRIQTYDRLTGRLLSAQVLPDRAELQAVILAHDPRRLVGVSMQQNRLWEFDADTLALVREAPIERQTKPGEFICCRSYQRLTPEGLYANCGNGLYRLRPEGDKLTIAAHREGLPGDIVFDEKRNRLIHAAWGWPLAALDPATLRVRQTLAIPARPERLAVDAATDRLFVAFPMEGRLLVVDLVTFEIRRWVSVAPGINLVAVDQRRRRLFLGGISPLVEVRSLDDFSVLARMWAPPWQRWMAFDAADDKLYVTSKLHGLWAIALDGAGRADWLTRHDPFFGFLSWALRALPIRRSLGWDHV